ncbi:MAG: hypothetical protein WKI04_03985 [Ferruginibacter sp.]
MDIRRGKSTDARLNALVHFAKNITNNRGIADAALDDDLYVQDHINPTWSTLFCKLIKQR